MAAILPPLCTSTQRLRKSKLALAPTAVRSQLPGPISTPAFRLSLCDQHGEREMLVRHRHSIPPAVLLQSTSNRFFLFAINHLRDCTDSRSKLARPVQKKVRADAQFL